MFRAWRISVKAWPYSRPFISFSPFLAHALGTLSGAFVAAKLAASHSMKFALAIGTAFLLGGSIAAAKIAGPLWFTVTDLVLAYLPMGYLGGVLAGRTPRKV